MAVNHSFTLSSDQPAPGDKSHSSGVTGLCVSHITLTHVYHSDLVFKCKLKYIYLLIFINISASSVSFFRTFRAIIPGAAFRVCFLFSHTSVHVCEVFVPSFYFILFFLLVSLRC